MNEGLQRYPKLSDHSRVSFAKKLKMFPSEQVLPEAEEYTNNTYELYIRKIIKMSCKEII